MTETKKFEGTTAAFQDLVSKRNWYTGFLLNGKEIKATNAWQIKIRLKAGTITQDYMETLLTAAGYKIVQSVIWQKEERK